MSWTSTAVLSLFLLLSSLCPSHQQAPAANITEEHGVVATDHAQCSEIGRDLLKRGGHAVDAAVASALCLGVVSPASSGIGGGAFMLIRLANGTTEAYDMRESAPAGVFENMYGGNATLKASGALSVAVPGELLGLTQAWEKYGKMPWKDLVTPAATLAKNGFKISPYLRMQMTKSESVIMADKGLRKMFTSDGNTLLRSGDVCYNKKLAETLSAISVNASVFYNGQIGEKLTEDIVKAGGVVVFKDLQRYVVRVREAIKMDVMGVEVLSMPPPSSGGLSLSLILNILAQYQDLSNVSNPLLSHREIEALKYALAARMDLADPDFVHIADAVNNMLSKDFAANLRKNISDDKTFDPSHYGARWEQIHDQESSHISVVDGERNAVSMTTSINSYFGSGFLSPKTGILLNNVMDDFSMPQNTTTRNNGPSPAPGNFFVHGKRPLSSMTPTIVVKDGQLNAVVGAGGGSFTIATMVEVLVNHIVKQKDPLSCVLAPRLYPQVLPNVVSYENWTVPTGEHFEVPKITRDALAKKGHVLQSLAGGTICQLIVQEKGQLFGISDPRKGGAPAGF